MKLLRVLFAFILAAATLAAADFYLKDGDSVVFYGDSITDQRLYTTFTETYVVTRFPQLKVRFVHSGWGGDRVTGGGGGPVDVRLDRDVFPYKPTVMTVMLGMNDGSYRAFDQEIFDRYANGLESIVKNVKSRLPGIRMTLIEPSPYDDVTRWANFEGGYNTVLIRYGNFVKQLAAREGGIAADLNGPVVAMLNKARSLDRTLAERIIPDRVHPGPGGHLIMAEALLESWNAPAVVSAVTINAAGPALSDSANTEVAALRAENGAISWTQTDKSLPMPIDPKDQAMALAIHSSGFLDALDQQTLKVTGLTAARYALKIDGETAGAFGKEELAAGVNLAPLETPMMKQARQVHALTLSHNNIHFARWRQVQVPLQALALERTAAAMSALDSLEDEVVGRQRAAAQPTQHRFDLVPE